jgi:hypothetical protein
MTEGASVRPRSCGRADTRRPNRASSREANGRHGGCSRENGTELLMTTEYASVAAFAAVLLASLLLAVRLRRRRRAPQPLERVLLARTVKSAKE